jgi:hypothetical protein
MDYSSNAGVSGGYYFVAVDESRSEIDAGFEKRTIELL